MKVEKEQFDALLSKLIKAKPEPRKKIKTEGKVGSKSPIITSVTREILDLECSPVHNRVRCASPDQPGRTLR
jgi:hypothetical protein